MKLIRTFRRYQIVCLTLLWICTVSLFCLYRNYTKILEITFEGDLIKVEDISEQDISCVLPRKLIFFHETSSNASSSGIVSLSPRQACTVESAAKLNPGANIFLIFATLNALENTTIYIKKTDEYFKQLFAYPNIRVRRADLKKYTKNTPLEEWYPSGKLQKSQYLVSHTSDVMRYLTLWKYGGTYLDLDVIVMKNFDEIGDNFAAVQSYDEVAAGALNFDFRGWGHIIVEACVNEIKTDFRGDIWGHNGPGVVTKVLKNLCNSINLTDITEENCNGFKLLPAHSFYPIPYQSWRLYFDPEKIQEVINMSKDSYGIHVWNKLSSELSINTNKKDVAYTFMAKLYCPNVYKASGDNF